MLSIYSTDRLSVFMQESESKNRKTGNVANLWVKGVTVADMCPAECPRRPSGDLAVDKAKAKSGILICYAWRGKAGLHVGKVQDGGKRFTRLELRTAIAGRYVRSATIGDLGMVPKAEFERMRDDFAAAGSRGFLGYTHAWKSAEWLRETHMASADSIDDADKASAMGWRYFRVAPVGTAIWRGRNEANEIVCPATLPGSKVTCATCGYCDGAQSKGKANVVVVAHGAGAKA